MQKREHTEFQEWQNVARPTPPQKQKYAVNLSPLIQQILNFDL